MIQTDTINLSIYQMQPPVSHHPKMALEKRAAQFAPFAALTGYEDAVIETARIVDQEHPLEEDAKDQIDRSLHYLADHQEKEVRITYFEPDKRKDGGSIKIKKGKLKRIDSYNQAIIFKDGSSIAIKAVKKIEMRK